MNENDNYPNDHYFSSEENQEVTIGGVWCYTCIISVALLQHSVLLCVDFYLSAHVLIFFAYILNYGKTHVV